MRQRYAEGRHPVAHKREEECENHPDDKSAQSRDKHGQAIAALKGKIILFHHFDYLHVAEESGHKLIRRTYRWIECAEKLLDIFVFHTYAGY